MEMDYVTEFPHIHMDRRPMKRPRLAWDFNQPQQKISAKKVNLSSFGSRHAEKYVKKGKLDWPAAATSTESIKAVLELPRLQNLVMQHVDHSAGYQIDLLQGLLKFDQMILNSILAVD